MMKRILALILCATLLLSGCSAGVSHTEQGDNASSSVNDASHESSDSHISAPDNPDASPQLESAEAVAEITFRDPQNLAFTGMDDAELLPYVESTVYLNLLNALGDGDYYVENVSAVYISQEYIDELTYNSQSNIYFGYTLEELNQQFSGQRYIFTLGEDGTTIVQEMETFYNDATNEILKNVAIGGGVILLCVTVSVVSAGLGAPAVSIIFAAAAKTGTTFALSSAALGGVSAAIVSGYQTHDLKQALETSAVAASQGFKWGAITGAVLGGGTSAIALHGATASGLTMNEAAAIQIDSHYPLDVIKQFKSVEEYAVYKNAGLKAAQIGNKTALVRNIDLNYVSELGGKQVTNLQRMAQGYAPVYRDPVSGLEKAYQLHHINQNPQGTLAILTEAEHQGNSAILNIFGKESEIDRQIFNKIRAQFWKDFAAQVL